ncbi:MAG: hypothetical protein JKY25_09605 [Robiginitomaculum sp.]|nr:hypothetical protein [Robiginitomaculum sp.]
MTNNLPATIPSTIPSLARVFENEREDLRALITSEDLSSARAVSEARRALDRTGDAFAASTDDMQIQKAGLWLLEMVKSGAGVLDRGAKADIVWREVPRTSARVIAGSTLFYGAALLFFVAGLVQGSTLTMLAGAVLAALRFFDPKDWKDFIAKKIALFSRRKQKLLEAPDGNRFMADAHVSVEAAGYVDALAEALRTADHVLMRLAEPVLENKWTDDGRLTSLMQSLLEAQAAGDQEFAMKLIDGELTTILNADGIEIVNYTRRTAKLFDILPALDLEDGKTKQAAPALMIGDKVLRRGTVWKS